MGCVAGKTGTEDLPAASKPRASLPSSREDTQRRPLRGSYDKEYSLIRLIALEPTGKRVLVSHKPTALERSLKSILKITIEEDLRAYLTRVESQLSLDHPNLLKPFSVFEDQFSFDIISEAWDCDLISYLLRSNHLTEKLAATFSQQILGGLQCLHKKKIIHRGVWWENIVIKRGNSDRIRVALKDFSALGGFSDGNFDIIGSLPFSAPESFYMEYSEKSDVWSAGCLLYMVVSGQYPFVGSDDFQTRLQVDTHQVTFAAGNWQKVTPHCKSFISRLLTRDIDRRPTATEALADPWLLSFGSLKEEQMDLTDLHLLAKGLKLGKAVACVTGAPLLTASEQQILIDVYTHKDANQTGKLGLKDLKIGLSQLATSEEAEQWLSLLNPTVPADFLPFVNSCVSIRRRRACLFLSSTLSEIYPEGQVPVKDFRDLLGKGVVGPEATWRKLLSKLTEEQVESKEVVDRLMQVYV